MATIEVGIRIDEKKGISFFGVEDVNRRIASGARVIELRPGSAVVQEIGGKGPNEHFALAGCQIEIILEDT